MDRPLLDAEELDAIQMAMRQARPAHTVDSSEAQKAMPVALIADDRAAERARPNGLKLAERWVAIACTRLLRLYGAKLEVEGVGVEILDGPTVRDEVSSSWTGCVEVPDRQGLAVVSVSGALIETMAVRMLGASPDEIAGERTPSPTTLRIFSPVGHALIETLADAWREEQGCAVDPVDPERTEGWLRGLNEGEVVVVITLTLGGAMTGRIRVVARPETLVIPPAPVMVVPAPPGAIDEVLGAVPVEIRVDLGSTWMTMAQLAELQPGMVIGLHQSVHDLLPVRCAGVVKAYGRALVWHGALAVEVVDPNREGSKAE